jgi:hypothetical protein
VTDVIDYEPSDFQQWIKCSIPTMKSHNVKDTMRLMNRFVLFSSTNESGMCSVETEEYNYLTIIVHRMICIQF